MMRPIISQRRIGTLSLALAATFVLAGAAAADPGLAPALSSASAPASSKGTAELAAPGRCAEPRAAVDLRIDDDFPVAGPVSARFDAVDVAANAQVGDPRLQVARPGGAQAMTRPGGACDQPGAGCGGVQAVQPVVSVPPIIPGTRPPRAPR